MKWTKCIPIILCLWTSIVSWAQVAPQINCIIQNQGNPIVEWTEGVTGILCGNYTLYVSINGGPYNSLTSYVAGNDSTYTHNGADGLNNLLGYYIACDSDPTITSDTVFNTRLIAPEIISVSVISATEIEINWKPGVSPSTSVYKVYELTPAPFLISPDIIGHGNTTYRHDYGAPIKRTGKYVVSAANSCGDMEDVPLTGYSETMYNIITTNKCDASLSLDWTPYIGWNDLNRYEVIVHDQTANSRDTIAVDKDSTQYELKNVIDGNTVSIKIRAVNDQGHESFSNEITDAINIVSQPDFTNLSSVSVLNNNKIELKFYTDNEADIRSFEVYRRAGTGEFISLGIVKVPLPSGTSPLDLKGRLSKYITYEDDNNVQAHKQSYDYIIKPIDSCGQIYESNIASSIQLNGNAHHDYINELDWGTYAFLGNGLDDYSVLRQDDSDSSRWVNIASTLIDEFNDDVQAETASDFTRDSDGIFCYRILANTTPSDTDSLYGLDSIAISSNIKCMVQWPPFQTAIPNAFSPNGDGVNDTFKCNLIFVTNDGFLLTIYDRWGRQVFETDDPSIGWDGKFHGNMKIRQNIVNTTAPLLPPGMYIYTLRFRLPDPSNPARMETKELRQRLILVRN